MPKYESDSIEHLKNSDLVQLSRKLLDSMVESTQMMYSPEMTPKKLMEAKVVLGYLNAAKNTMDTRIKIFKLTGLGEKIDAIKNHKIK